MSLPRVRRAFTSSRQLGETLMKPLSYSITVSCLGHLIRGGHQLSHHFHWEDQQSFAIPANTSQSPVWAAHCPQAYLQSLVKQQRLRCVPTDSQTQLKCQLVMKQHKIRLNNVQIKRREDKAVVVSLTQYHKWLDLSLNSYNISKTSPIIKRSKRREQFRPQNTCMVVITTQQCS